VLAGLALLLAALGLIVAALAQSGMALFLAGPVRVIWGPPHESNLEYGWRGLQLVQGNAYVLAGLALLGLAALYLRATRPKEGVEGQKLGAFSGSSLFGVGSAARSCGRKGSSWPRRSRSVVDESRGWPDSPPVRWFFRPTSRVKGW